LNGYTKTRNHRKILQKTQKRQQSTVTKRIANTDIHARQGPGFFIFSLAGEGGSHPCHPSVMPLIRCISNMSRHNIW